MEKRVFYIRIETDKESGNTSCVTTDSSELESLKHQMTMADSQYVIHLGSDTLGVMNNFDAFYVGMLIGEILQEEKQDRNSNYRGVK